MKKNKQQKAAIRHAKLNFYGRLILETQRAGLYVMAHQTPQGRFIVYMDHDGKYKVIQPIHAFNPSKTRTEIMTQTGKLIAYNSIWLMYINQHKAVVNRLFKRKVAHFIQIALRDLGIEIN